MPEHLSGEASAKTEPDFIKDSTIKNYLKEQIKLRSSQESIDHIDSTFNSLIIAVIKEAAKLAQEAKRKTILDEDITPAIEKVVAKKHLSWEETLEQILQQTPADLGKISKGINDYIEKEKK